MNGLKFVLYCAYIYVEDVHDSSICCSTRVGHMGIHTCVGFRPGEPAPYTIVRAGLGCKTNLSLTKTQL